MLPELPNLTDTQKSFDAMRTNLLTVNTAVNTLQEDVKEVTMRTTLLEEILLVGKGDQPSIKDQVRGNTEYIKNLKYWAKFIGGALIVQTIAFFFAVIVAIVRFLPLLEKLADQP